MIREAISSTVPRASRSTTKLRMMMKPSKQWNQEPKYLFPNPHTLSSNENLGKNRG
jgi:hypothetical protein